MGRCRRHTLNGDQTIFSLLRTRGMVTGETSFDEGPGEPSRDLPEIPPRTSFPGIVPRDYWPTPTLGTQEGKRGVTVYGLNWRRVHNR